MIRHAIPLIFFALVLGFTPHQTYTIRVVMADCKPPPFVAIIDAILPGELSYTAADLQHIFIDAIRFEDAPTTFANVIRHECAHTRGLQHGDPDPIMHYAVTLDAHGRVINDASLIGV